MIDEILWAIAFWTAMGIPVGFYLLTVPEPLVEKKFKHAIYMLLVGMGMVALAPVMLISFVIGLLSTILGGKQE